MSQNNENLNKAIDSEIVSSRERVDLFFKSDEKVILSIVFDDNSEDWSQRGVYNKIDLTDRRINAGNIYGLDAAESEGGALPHGSACYLAKWDLILLGDELTTSLTQNHGNITVLAHEIGHRLLHQENLDVDGKETEKEILAWQKAIDIFGQREDFNINYAQSQVQYLKDLLKNESAHQETAKSGM